MTSTQLYEYCDQHEIETYHVRLKENASVSICVGEACAIGIDETGMTEAEKRTHLAHEIGHCERGAFYSPYSKLDLRSQNEHKANVWAINMLLPKEEMLEAMRGGNVEVWQLAEYFTVTEDLIRFAARIYFGRDV